MTSPSPEPEGPISFWSIRRKGDQVWYTGSPGNRDREWGKPGAKPRVFYTHAGAERVLAGLEEPLSLEIVELRLFEIASPLTFITSL